ncbi:hypothetical protein BRADI_4g00886v3 [Brachypodium distachyon]|uniref:Uncharacterized protein n=1 Tax=Brachypodium distachyon TaxID=15368 RepID=A0A0Q3L031_BRADI|nr:hypothetical protein BRADI_4g00886v3 [Brachypodium distachyon]
MYVGPRLGARAAVMRNSSWNMEGRHPYSVQRQRNVKQRGVWVAGEKQLSASISTLLSVKLIGRTPVFSNLLPQPSNKIDLCRCTYSHPWATGFEVSTVKATLLPSVYLVVNGRLEDFARYL